MRKNTNKLEQMVLRADRRLCVPLMGYPGSRLTDTTLKQNAFNWGIHCWSLYELAYMLDPDGLFFMMDLSVEAGALGVPVRYGLQDSPSVEQHMVKTSEDLMQFMSIDILKDARILMYLKTMEWMAKHISVLKCAYCIGPFTLAGLLMGASDSAMATIENPDLAHDVLAFSARVISRYATALFDSGADLLAILEPTAVMLSPAQFREFSGAYVANIVVHLKGMTVLHICGDTTHLVESMSRTGVDGLSLDSMVDFTAVAPKLKPGCTLIGNIDPVRVLRDQTPDQVRRVTREFLEKTRGIPNLVVSSGCDLPQDTPIENIRAMIEETKSFPYTPSAFVPAGKGRGKNT